MRCSLDRDMSQGVKYVTSVHLGAPNAASEASSRSRSADEAVEAAEEQVRLPRRKAGRAPGLRYCLLLPPPPLLGATIAS